jgi:hypothetical protein
MKTAFQVSETQADHFRQTAVRIREVLDRTEEELPPDAVAWRQAVIGGLLQAYSAAVTTATEGAKTATGASRI